MRYISLFALLFTLTNTVAQVIDSELYQYNYFFINPAFAGKEGQNFSAMTSIAKAKSFSPVTNGFVAYDTKFEKINSGLGLIGKSITIGPQSQASISVNYSYNLKLSEISNVRFGARIENQRTSIDFSQYQSTNPDDPIFSASSITNWNFSGSLASLLTIKDFYFGFSADNLLRTNHKDYFFSEDKRILYHPILGYSFKAGTWGELMHSAYVPFYGDKLVKVDLNNILLIRNKIITGLTLEIRDQNLIPKLNAGYKWGELVQVTTMLYSKRRDDDSNKNVKFNGSLVVRFYFK